MNRTACGPRCQDSIAGVLSDPAKKRAAASPGQAYVMAYELIQHNRAGVETVADVIVAQGDPRRRGDRAARLAQPRDPGGRSPRGEDVADDLTPPPPITPPPSPFAKPDAPVEETTDENVLVRKPRSEWEPGPHAGRFMLAYGAARARARRHRHRARGRADARKRDEARLVELDAEGSGTTEVNQIVPHVAVRYRRPTAASSSPSSRAPRRPRVHRSRPRPSTSRRCSRRSSNSTPTGSTIR